MIAEREAASSCARSFAVTRVARDGRFYGGSFEVLDECTALVRANGASVLRLACTPTDLRELAVGRLLAEGLLESATDVETIGVTHLDEGHVVDVVLKRPLPPSVAAGCEIYQASTGVPGEALGCRRAKPALRPLPPCPWCVEDVFSLCDLFARDTPLHHRTSGTHSCRLAVDGRLVYTSEDIGRHNAMDKAVGRLLLAGFPPKRAIMLSSGRVPTDMVEKAVRARVPVLATKAAPTDAAVEMARRYGLALVCKAGPEQMRIFSGADLAY